VSLLIYSYALISGVSKWFLLIMADISGELGLTNNWMRRDVYVKKGG